MSANIKKNQTQKESGERNFKKLSNVEHVRMRTGMWLVKIPCLHLSNIFFKKMQRKL